MTTSRTRRIAGAAIALASILGLSACASSTSASSSGKPVDGGTLKVAFFPDNPTFACVDPFQTYWIEHRTVIRNVADSLTDQDPKTGKIVPWLAKSWTVAKDGKTYTFHLRSGVTFSDGSKLDAAAVKANVDGWLATVKATDGAAFGASYVLGLTGAKVVNPTTVELDFDKPNSSFLQATSTTNLAIISPDSYRNTPEQRCLGKYTASGLFTLKTYSPNKDIVLVRRKGYDWGSSLSKNTGQAHLDRVEFSYVAEDSVRTGQLTSKAIDIDWPRNPFTDEDKALIEKSGDTVQARALPGVSYTLWPNTSAGHPLADRNVRLALYKALDLDTYASTVFGKDYPVVKGVFNSTTPYFSSQAAKLRHDAAGAKELLQKAGWTLGSDGYRAKDGKTLTLTLPVTQFSAGSELIQDQLKKVGIKVNLKVITTAERPALLQNGQYDLIETYFTRADPGALQFILNPALANSKAIALNATDASTRAKLLALFARAIETTDTAQTKAAYAELQSLLVDEGVGFPVFERVQQAGVASDVHGFAFTSESFLKLNDVWKSK